MVPTTIKLSKELKERIRTLVEGSEQSMHAFLLEAIEQRTSEAERRREFVATAVAAREEMSRTGKAFPADKVHAYVDAAIKERGLKRETFIGRKGDCFIWSCQLAHGGTHINDPKRTRKSLVTHYWRANDMAPHKLEGVNGGYYFAKDHQPVPADPLWKRLADRAWLEARWAGRFVKRAVGAE